MPIRPSLVPALLLAMLALALAVPPAPTRALSPAAAVDPACSPWPTTYEPPPTIRVLRTATGVVETVPLRRYVENVMSWEWPSSYPSAALQAGAIAVKQYAWYYVVHPRSRYVTPDGACYHVRDDTYDQIYDPSRTPAASQVAAVTATWDITLRKDRTFFLSGYGPGTSDTCGADLSSTRTRLAARGIRACARDGLALEAILRTYLDPGLTIAYAGRLFGADRYATAAAISAATTKAATGSVLVATGSDFPDALAAGPAAAAAGTSVLLTDPAKLSAATRTELARIGASRIILLGGPGAVSDGVAAELARLAPTVERIAGADRYETAALISAATFDPGLPLVFVATGGNFPDALAGAAAGARLGAPVLLVRGDSIPEVVAKELSRLAPAAIRVLGGPSAVNDGVLAALDAFAPDVARLAGADRYATAAAVAAAFYEPGVKHLDLATGGAFPDALAGSPRGGPLLLLSGAAPSAEVAAEIARLAPSHLEVFGGVGALSDTAVTRVVEILASPPAP
jgi:putative cell wall-binding protein